MFKDTKEGETHSYNDGCGEPQHNDMTTMTPLQKEIEAFREEFGTFTVGAGKGKKMPTEKELKSFLRQSLLRFTRSVIEEAMPKGRGFIEEGDIDMVDDSWNACLDKIRENTERILKDNEKEV